MVIGHILYAKKNLANIQSSSVTEQLGQFKRIIIL